MKNYYRIWIENKSGYSIDHYYIAEDETDAYLQAMEEHLHDDIMEVEEITEAEYDKENNPHWAYQIFK